MRRQQNLSGRPGQALVTTVAALAVLAAVMAVAPAQVHAGLIGSGNAGRCEALASEGIGSFCGGLGDDGSCSCQSGCVAAGNCCDDYRPVCLGDFECAPDSGQIAFLHVGGMCSTKWDYANEPDTLADVSGIANALSVDVRAVQTDVAGTQIAATTLVRYLDACCTDSNSCVIYNFSNGDNVVGYALDALASTTTICPGGVCEEVLDWNILEVRTAAGNGGGSELSNWGLLADLFGCDLSSQIAPSQARALYDHNNTRGVPVNHIGGFLDQVNGSDQIVLDAGWFFLPWHNDGAVGYHSAGARNTAVEWCGDGNNLAFDFDYFGLWCQDEDLCSSNYGTMFGGHSMAFCPMLMENVDHYDQKMAYISLMGQVTSCGSNADCNDGDPCTNDSCNGDNICVHTANTSSCDDGLFCTTGETCTAGVCGGGSATDCSGSSDQCNTGSCNEAADACEASPANEGGSCDDGLFCSTGETCGSGACGGGGATNCNDGVGCTTDSCNEGTDTCDSTPVDAVCDNGQFCDGAETCDAALAKCHHRPRPALQVRRVLRVLRPQRSHYCVSAMQLELGISPGCRCRASCSPSSRMGAVANYGTIISSMSTRGRGTAAPGLPRVPRAPTYLRFRLRLRMIIATRGRARAKTGACVLSSIKYS